MDPLNSARSQGNTLEPNYQNKDGRSQLNEVVITYADGTKRKIPVSDIWMDEERINCLPFFNFEKIRNCNLIPHEIIANELHFFSTEQEKVSLKIFYRKEMLLAEVYSGLNVSNFKKILQEKFGLPTSEFLLKDKDGLPPNGFHLLSQCRGSEFTIEYEKSSQLKLDEKNRGKNSLEAKTKFSDFEREIEVPINEINKENVIWRKIGQGLSLEGKCITRHCPANYEKTHLKARAHITKSGSFDTDEERVYFDMDETCVEAKCFSCKQLLKEVESCFFLNCIYSVIEKDDKPIIDKKQTRDGYAITYDSSPENTKKFINLGIFIEKIPKKNMIENNSKSGFSNSNNYFILAGLTILVVGAIFLWPQKNKN